MRFQVGITLGATKRQEEVATIPEEPTNTESIDTSDWKLLATYSFLLGVTLCIISLNGLSQSALPSSSPNLALITPEELQPLFEEAATAFDIPSDLLKAIGLVESGWNQALGSKDGGFGIMQLTGTTLTQAAQLLKSCRVCGNRFAGLTLDDIKKLLKENSLKGAEANIWGGAAILDSKWENVVNLGLTPENARREALESWWFAVTAYNGLIFDTGKTFVRSNYPFRVYNLFFNDTWREHKEAEGKIPLVNITLPPNVTSALATKSEIDRGLVNSWDQYLEPQPPTSGLYIRLTPTPPSAPSSLIAKRISQTQIDLSWTYRAKLGTAEGFKIYRRSDLPGGGNEELVRIVEPNVNKFSDTALNPNTRYCYQVSAFNTNGESDRSNEECPNSPPIVNAGSDQTVQVGSTVQLDGSGSTDPDGDPLDYYWRFISRPRGSKAKLSNSRVANPTFVVDKEGEYILELRVRDRKSPWVSDRVTITAQTILWELYGEDSASNLLKIDPQTGEGTLIGPIGFSQVKDIAFTLDGKLYGVASNRLLQIDPNTGKGTAIGPPGLCIGIPEAENINALISQPDGTLLAASGRGKLISINPNTGCATIIGYLNFGTSGDLAYAPDGRLFASGYGYPDNLYLVDPNTGASTLIGSIGYYDVYGLAFSPDGKLYGASSTGPRLIKIDLKTGAGEEIGTITNTNGSMWGLAVRIIKNVSAKTAISTERFDIRPFHTHEGIVFTVTAGQDIQIAIFNLAGYPVFNTDWVPNGYTWNLGDKQGRILANGVYLYVVRVRGFNGEEYVSEVRKLVIVR